MVVGHCAGSKAFVGVREDEVMVVKERGEEGLLEWEDVWGCLLFMKKFFDLGGELVEAFNNGGWYIGTWWGPRGFDVEF